MLAEMLPGIREVRAPLVGGYLWLLLAWLLWGNPLPERERAPDVIVRLYELEPVLQGAGIVVVASVAAYLVGTFVNTLVLVIGRRVTWIVRLGVALLWMGWRKTAEFPRTRWLRWMQEGAPRVSHDRAGTLSSWAHKERVRLSQEDGYQPAWSLDATVLAQLDLIKTQLVGSEPELFGEIDRRDGEAAFRFSVAPPLAALSIVMATQHSAVWSVGVLGCLALLWQGVHLRQQAGDLIVDAIYLGRVTPLALELWRQQGLEERATSRPPSEPRTRARARARST